MSRRQSYPAIMLYTQFENYFVGTWKHVTSATPTWPLWQLLLLIWHLASWHKGDKAKDEIIKAERNEYWLYCVLVLLYCTIAFRLRQGQHGRAYRHGLTVPIFSCSTGVPCGTAHPCQVAGTLVRDSSPGRSLTGPVRSGPRSMGWTKTGLRSRPVRSGPVRSWTDAHP